MHACNVYSKYLKKWMTRLQSDLLPCSIFIKFVIASMLPHRFRYIRGIHQLCSHSPIRHWNVYYWSCFYFFLSIHVWTLHLGSFYSISARFCRLTLYADYVHFILSVYVIFRILQEKAERQKEETGQSAMYSADATYLK